jgi:tetratricopeptide (TPR) repeat protein
VSLAWVKAVYDWEFAEAEREFLRAIELNPTYATAYHWYSVLLAVTGRYDEAVEQIRKAAELDPLSRIINENYGQWLGLAGRHEEGVEQLRKTVELDPRWALGHLRLGQHYDLRGLFSEAIPHYEKAFELDDSPYGLGGLGHAYAKSGRVDEAHAVLERLDELANSRYVAPLERAYVYAGLGDLDKSFEWLEKAYDERASNLLFARVLPIRKDIEHDPRFSDLMRRMGLEE